MSFINHIDRYKKPMQAYMTSSNKKDNKLILQDYNARDNKHSINTCLVSFAKLDNAKIIQALTSNKRFHHKKDKPFQPSQKLSSYPASRLFPFFKKLPNGLPPTEALTQERNLKTL